MVKKIYMQAMRGILGLGSGKKRKLPGKLFARKIASETSSPTGSIEISGGGKIVLNRIAFKMFEQILNGVRNTFSAGEGDQA